MRVFSFVVALAIAACSVEDKSTTPGLIDFTILDVVYYLPENEVEGLVRKDQGGPAVTVKPIGKSFELVADDKYVVGFNYQKSGSPLIRFINTHPSHSFETFDFYSGQTVCRSNDAFLDCGMRLEDDSVPWFVLFNRSEVPNSEAIRTQARKLVRTYRQNHSLTETSTNASR